MAQARSQVSFFTSTSRRIISGTAITGWVSLSWKAIRSGRPSGSKSLSSTSKMKSASEQATKKYCCCRRSSLLRGGVLRVENLGDVLREGLRAHRVDVVTGVEDGQVERLRGLGAPQPQGVDPAVLVAGHHVVVGHPDHAPVRDPAGALGAVLIRVLLGATGEVHRLGGLRVRELPGLPSASQGSGCST